MSKERLSKAVKLLPLDRLQSAAADRGIKHLSEEEAEEIATELENAISELPDILDEFDAAFAEVVQEEIVIGSIVAAIYHYKFQIDEVKEIST